MDVERLVGKNSEERCEKKSTVYLQKFEEEKVTLGKRINKL